MERVHFPGVQALNLQVGSINAQFSTRILCIDIPQMAAGMDPNSEVLFCSGKGARSDGAGYTLTPKQALAR